MDRKICFFSSPIGLGHATRDIAIAEDILARSKNQAKIKFTSGNGASTLISDYGFECNSAYYPPKFSVENGVLKKPTSWMFRYYSYYRKCKSAAEKIIAYEKPDLIVSDEDFASLVCSQKKGIKNILITDILQTNFSKGNRIGAFVEKKMNDSMKNIIKKCNLVLIPQKIQGSADSQLSFECKKYENIVQLDPIVRKTKYSREQLRSKFDFKKKTVLVTVGGTAAGGFLLEKVSRSLHNIDENIDVVLAPGPSIKDIPKSFRNLGFVRNLHEAIYAADLVISLAGKSTIDEAKYYGTPGIFIPIAGHFEQEDNAMDEGFSFDNLDKLDKFVIEKIDQARKKHDHNSLQNGTDQSSKMISDLLEHE